MKGRLTMVSTSASTTKYSSYDEFGDVLTSQQVTSSITYPFAYSYNKLSEITQMTYPSGRTVQNGYDNAGRVTCVWGGTATTCPTTGTFTYATGVAYAANGGMSSLTLGNSLMETTTFNKRFQPSGITLGSLLSLSYSYGTGTNGTVGDNGNVQSQTITASGQPTIQQTYTYDTVNRLSTFSETGSHANQNYSYDAYGNRYLPGTNWIPYAGQTPTSNNFTNNQWAAGSTVFYDFAGNQTAIAITGGTTMRPSCAQTLQPGVAMLIIACYDAENRMTTAMTAGLVTTSYVYDGDGRRVSKTVGSGPATVFVYDAAGSLAGEYGGPTNPLSGTTYLTGDHLGSTRLVTSATAAALQRFDYAPFGEELTQGIDGRTAPYSTNQYPTGTLDGTSEKFTSKERDAETGLDFFGARYFSASQGRFTGADSPFADQHTEDPQTWNLYSYGRNNPLMFVDPNGRNAVTDFFERLWNWSRELGWATNNQVAARTETQRAELLEHARDDNAKNWVSHATPRQINSFYNCMQSEDCMAAQHPTVHLIPQAVGVIGPFARDLSGRIHDELPDRIPDNWKRGELETARDELEASIKARIQDAMDHGGPDASHAARLRQEQQLLRQVLDKLGGN